MLFSFYGQWEKTRTSLRARKKLSCLPYTIESYQLDAWKIKARNLIVSVLFSKKKNIFQVSVCLTRLTRGFQ